MPSAHQMKSLTHLNCSVESQDLVQKVFTALPPGLKHFKLRFESLFSSKPTRPVPASYVRYLPELLQSFDLFGLKLESDAYSVLPRQLRRLLLFPSGNMTDKHISELP
jgi:hypothetical protein